MRRGAVYIFIQENINHHFGAALLEKCDLSIFDAPEELCRSNGMLPRDPEIPG